MNLILLESRKRKKTLEISTPHPITHIYDTNLGQDGVFDPLENEALSLQFLI